MIQALMRVGVYAPVLVASSLLAACGGGAEPPGSSIPQSISFASPGAQTFNTAPPALAAAASSGLAVRFDSSTPAVCTVAGTRLTLLAAGPCTVTASQNGDATYAAAETVAQTFTVNKAPQSITFVPPGNQTVGANPATLTGSATSGLTVSFASSSPTICSVSGALLTALAAGRCTVDATQAGNANYLAALTVFSSFDIALQMQPQTISFPSPGLQTLGSTPPPLAATASSGLAVSYTSMTPAVCTVSANMLSLLTTGTCSIAASQSGNVGFAAASTVVNSFAVAAAAQTISFAMPGSQSLAAPSVALVASASSGLPVSYTSGTLNVCTVSGSTLSLLATGTCTVTANQAGNATFAAAAPVSQSFAVALGAQTISFASPGNQTFGTVPPPLVATASSGLPVTLASTTPSVCTVNGNTLSLVAAGTCIVEASQAGSAGFSAAMPVSRVFTVGVAPLTAQTISFASPGNQTLGIAPPPLVATTSSGLSVTLASTTPSVCTVNGNALSLLAVGTCIVDASQAGNASFSAAVTISRVFTVSAAPLTAQIISFASPGSQTLATPPPLLSASASSGLVVSFVSITPAVCTVSGNNLSLVSAGNCGITASQAGNTVFQAAAPVTVSFVVSAAPLTAQTISFTSPGPQTLLSATPALSATASSGLPVTFISTTPAVCQVSGTTLSLVAAGTCTILANQAGGGNFGPAPTVSVSFAVNLAAQSINFPSPGELTLRLATPALSASAPGGPVSFASTTSSVCTVSGTSLTLVGAGTCIVQATQAGSATYAAATTSVSFLVNKYELFGNGGFEVAGTTTPAEGWLAAASGYTRSTDARSGMFSARLASIPFNAAVMLQNSLEQGNRLPLEVGTTPTLTFWAKGSAGGTGNVLFALRYLDGVGNILGNSMNQRFETLINPNTWTVITYTLPVGVPAGATAAFIEFSQAIGPIDAGNPAGEVLIDDISLK